MTTAQTSPRPGQRHRLWPGVMAGGLLALTWFGAPHLSSEPWAAVVAVLSGFIGAAAIIAWWALFSRAPRVERWGAVGLIAVALIATPHLLDESVARGNLGFQFFIYAVPTLSLALVVWAVASRRLASGARRASLVVTIVLASGAWALVRSNGVTGDGMPEFAWRWSATAEERLLANAADADSTAAPPFSSVVRGQEAHQDAEWPGLRGPGRDGVVRGSRIDADWVASPPVQLWRRPIGPSVSSFAVRGNLLYTQEQRGEYEMVSAYHVATGEPVWRHRDATRFWDAHVGAGHRATPALGGGRVYALGTTGILNALDAASGALVWSRNAAADVGAERPLWAFVNSPLVAEDIVIVYAGAFAAYDLATGELRWLGPSGGESYSSPHLTRIEDVAQILLLASDGLISVAPTDGVLLWKHAWPGIGIVQPALIADGDILFSMINSAAAPVGTRRIAIAREAGGWVTEERWTSLGLKPSFSSVVVHDGHAFGFDGRLLASIALANGERQWKGGRYGSGQLLLLPDQDLLLIVSEQGELALVDASAERFTELARVPTIAGRTWSQPALVDGVLLVRNDEEMAAFRLARQE